MSRQARRDNIDGSGILINSSILNFGKGRRLEVQYVNTVWSASFCSVVDPIESGHVNSNSHSVEKKDMTLGRYTTTINNTGRDTEKH